MDGKSAEDEEVSVGPLICSQLISTPWRNKVITKGRCTRSLVSLMGTTRMDDSPASFTVRVTVLLSSRPSAVEIVRVNSITSSGVKSSEGTSKVWAVVRGVVS